MTNGGTGPFFGQLVLINSGRGPLPPSIALVNPNPPHNTTVLLDNFFGRQFNSLNDIKIFPGTNKLFFTDVTWVSHISEVGSALLTFSVQIRIPQPLPAATSDAQSGVPL